MTPRPPRMSPEARAWYLAEIQYLADRNLDAAARVVDMIATARFNLAQYTDMGQVGLIPGTRRLVVGQYVLTTRFRGRVLEIVAIRNTRQGDAYTPIEGIPDDTGNES